MYLLDEEWRDGYLDYARSPGQCRVRVRLWALVMPVDDLYVEHSRHWRVLWNYFREIGIRRVVQKVMSRRSERLRNQKSLAVGLGEVLEADEGSRFHRDQPVVFLAPCHPKCVERLSLVEALLQSLRDPGHLDHLPADSLAFFEAMDFAPSLARRLGAHAGWSSFSGRPVGELQTGAILSEVEAQIGRLDLSRARKLPLGRASQVSEIRDKRPPVKECKTAVLFGYGQHAKTNIAKNLHSGIRMVKVHEIDPCQIGRVDQFPSACDTSPYPRDSERFDAYFVAGYHHTHAPVATEALRRGAAVVLEKPLATTWPQLEDLVGALRASPGSRLFSGYQKRYSSLTRLAFQDLGVKRGEPVSYHCIVYEIAVPQRHWYNWPNSGSRILSNGCHWIDHFLFLNDFSTVSRFEVLEAEQGGLLAFVTLNNGGFFSLTLSDVGSPRIGMQEYVELRAGRRTVRIHNFSEYHSEDSRRVLRAERVNKLHSFQTMYQEISRKIVEGLPGEEPESVMASAGLVLKMEQRLQEARRLACRPGVEGRASRTAG